jgi:phytoene dehydrogenase-like protein
MKSVVIIGAGIGGLTTAAYLAQAGMHVSVYEQQRLDYRQGNYFTIIQC